ncbi:MAG: hypothetical protein IJ488_00575 [Clostridia bacterium]|nr:hypothetical protein [Clostridia bacterium]
MKRILAKIIVLMLAFATLAMLLVSCGEKISGEYISEGDIGKVELTFKGNKILYKSTTYDYAYNDGTFEKVVSDITELEMTYKLSDGKITCYADTRVIGFAYIMDSSGNKYFYEQNFEQGDGYIKIGKTTYTAK